MAQFELKGTAHPHESGKFWCRVTAYVNDMKPMYIETGPVFDTPEEAYDHAQSIVQHLEPQMRETIRQALMRIDIRVTTEVRDVS
jgi:hypothetical protein